MPDIIICADDYGLNPAISSGVEDLIEKKRVSATSCITNFNGWPLYANHLKPYLGKIDIGLHFNLTEGHSLTTKQKFPSLKKLISNSYFNKLDREFIVKEFTAQLSLFTENLGYIPSFIDGHQHIQQLPIIRDALIETYLRNFPNKQVYFRVSTNGFLKSLLSIYNFPKPFIIDLLGARAWRKQLECLNIPYNKTFSGIYNLKKEKNYRNYFKKFIYQLSTNGILMCHPSLNSNEMNDPIKKARLAEYNYLNSEFFLKDCQDLDVKLIRFSKLRNSFNTFL